MCIVSDCECSRTCVTCGRPIIFVVLHESLDCFFFSIDVVFFPIFYFNFLENNFYIKKFPNLVSVSHRPMISKKYFCFH